MSVPTQPAAPAWPIDLKTALLLTAGVATTLVIFALDLILPLGVAAAVPYVVPILISMWLPWRTAPFAFAAAATVLTALDYFLSPSALQGTPLWVVVGNRLLSVLMFGIVAVLCWWRQRYADQLDQERARLRSVIDISLDAIVAIDERGLIQSFSRGGERLFGYTEREVLGRNVSMLMPEPHRSRHDQYLDRYLRTGESRIMGAGRMVEAQRRDGSVFPVNLMVGEVNAGGRRLFTGFVQDMTERERARSKIHDLQIELYRIGRLSELGEIASAIAHELNQPLTAISNYVRAGANMARTLEGDAAAKVILLMDKAVQQTDRAGQIIRRLRQLIGRGQAELLPVSINDVIGDACALALIDTRQKGINVSFDLTDALPDVLADATQIQQVIFNLVRNSVDALHTSERREIVVRTAAGANGDIEVSVSDTGPGLPPEVEERLFMPFVTTKPNGMGIGLSICRSIIDAHDGRIWGRSRPEGGAIFAFQLPAHEGAEMEQ